MNGQGLSPRIKISKLRPLASNSRKPSVPKRNILNLSLKKKGDPAISFTAFPHEMRTPKQLTLPKRTDRGFPVHLSDKFSLNNTLESSANSSFKLNSSLNRSNNCLSRDETRSARPSPRAKIAIRHKSISHAPSDPDTLLLFHKLPISPPEVLKEFESFMTKYEQNEVLEYSEIYFLGLKSKKIQPDPTQANFGYDDDRSDYKLVTGDHISYRYEIIEILGKGSFGQVCKCLDHKTKKLVALKIIRNQRRFHRQGKVEIKVLQHMNENGKDSEAHCVQMEDCFIFRKHLCITFELLSINLYELLKNNGFHGFSLTLVKRFGIQILICLAFLREHKIIHCDLKPENILLKHPNKSGIKVIDFGSSCFEEEKLYTYIQSRFYRAPEIILGIPYTVAIDMWSLGCILAELHSGCPIFPGESEHEQLLCIMEVKGLPPEELMEQATRKNLFFEEMNPKIVPNSRGKKRFPGTRTLEEKAKSSDEVFLGFIERCLDWNPFTRMTPDEAFEHPWIKEAFQNSPSNRMLLKSSTGSRGDGS
ncbi:DYRK4_2 [Blepharisma stoltei]|uniref:dual-specificity kinase n=1 Tax=Blepharisma stoltei TaxID=1481888 RepID=A0AAU9KDU2_9CILI|nr:unnamed protein product [Blepharisma stoltei]